MQINPGEVISILHDDVPVPASYTWVGHVPTSEDVSITLLPGDNLVTTVPLRFGPIMTSDLLELVEYGTRIGSWDPVAQETRWHPDDGDWLLPTCSPVHVEVTDESPWPPPGGEGGDGGSASADGGTTTTTTSVSSADGDGDDEAEAEAEAEADGDADADADGGDSAEDGDGGSVTADDGGDDSPPDPAVVAPPLDTTVTHRFYDGISFLFEGETPVQVGVSEGTIDAGRVAVLRGTVAERDGDPLEGVTVSVLRHPEYGYTLTRADGRYDLAINGGQSVTLVFSAEDMLPAQRTVVPGWQRDVEVRRVALVELDAEVTLIELDDPIEMHVASPVSDADGSRTAVLMFRDETVATMVMPNESTEVLESFSVRATEYTVGSEGPDAMPGELPPASAYTYAVEYTIDEAESAGAVRVDLSPPAIAYVENFVGFPVGGAVPLGAYDPIRGAWIASPNGRVIEVTGVSGSLAQVDITGDGVAENSTALAAIGIDNDEREALASQYTTGTELWRMPTPHLSPWDANWGFGPPDDAEFPPADPPQDPQQPNDCEQAGSIVECDTQVLGEELPVAGTPFTLAYRSDRVPGRLANYHFRVPVFDTSIAANLERADVEIEIAGRSFSEVVETNANPYYDFVWDGLDAYDRRVQGPVPVHACVFFNYNVIYGNVGAAIAAFGRYGGGAIQGDRHSSMVRFQRCQARRPVAGSGFGSRAFSSGDNYALGVFDARRGSPALGGWTLSPHHTLAPEAGLLFLGDGHRETFAHGVDPLIVTHVAGGGAASAGDGDGGPAATVRITGPSCGAMGPDGSIYFCDTNRIRRIDPDGVIHAFAGSGAGSGPIGDGGPATSARLNSPRGVDVGPDGSVYIADALNRRVRRVAPDGTISTFAGTGTSGTSGDEGPATSALLQLPSDVAVAPDGTVYVADGGNTGRIRRIAPDGVISRFAGGGSCGGPDGRRADSTCLQGVEAIALATDGTLYLTFRAASTAVDQIFRIDPAGRMWFVAGVTSSTTSGALDDGIPASTAWLNHVQGLDVSVEGFVYFADSARQIVRYIDADGLVHTLAGTDTVVGSIGDDGPAQQARLGQPSNVFRGLDGSVYFLERFNRNIRRISALAPGFSTEELLIPTKGYGEVYVFDQSGRHLRTHNGRTGTLKYAFDYDEDGRLVTVTDAYAAVTEIVRDGSGIATAIIGPDGHETLLEMNEDGYLETITNPAGEAHAFDYTEDGLMTEMTAPGNELHAFEYDELGRLILDTDPEDGSIGLTRTESGRYLQIATIEVSSTLGRTTTLEHTVQPSSGVHRLEVTLPDGSVNRRMQASDGVERLEFEDGTEVRSQYSPMPFFGMLAPVVRTETETPGGLVRVVESSRAVVLETGGNALDIETVIETSRLNGRTTQWAYDANTRVWAGTTPAGRDITLTMDAHDRPTQIDAPGLESIVYDYDARGRIETATIGTSPDERTWTFSYDAAGELESVEDPAHRVVDYTRDPVGRVLEVLGPDLETTELDYDDRGNLTEVTPPDRTVHVLSYDGDDRNTAYTPPDLGAGTETTQYVYDEDDALIQVVRPNAQVIDFEYDEGGRLETIEAPHGTFTVTYDIHGRVDDVEGPSGAHLSYDYDGRLLTRVVATGDDNGITWDYDDDFRVATETIEGVEVAFDYDADGLLVAAGAIDIARDPSTGWPTTITAGEAETSVDFDTFGQLTAMAHAYDSDALLSFAYQHDALGRIVSISETLNAATTVTEYAYDDASRLASVTVDSEEVFSFDYDGNGNRASITSGAGTVTADFDAQDRLVALGTIELEYAVTGELLSRTDGVAITQYEHDPFGHLVAVELPDSTLIEYEIDARGRRIGRSVDSVVDRGWRYHDQLNPVTELDSNGDVVARFVYGYLKDTPDVILRNGTTYRILVDHLGSVRMVVDVATGDVAQELQYSPWGEVLLDTNPGFQPFGFAGGLYDPDTGLVSFGSRDYDPTLGRWISRDPTLFTGGNNLFAYANNDPVNFVDVDGQKPGDPFPTMHDAAVDFCAEYGGDTWRDGMERGSAMYLVCLPMAVGSALLPYCWYYYEKPTKDWKKRDGNHVPSFWFNDTGQASHCHSHPTGSPEPSPNDHRQCRGIRCFLCDGPDRVVPYNRYKPKK